MGRLRPPFPRLTASSAGDAGMALLPAQRQRQIRMTGVFDYVVGIPTAVMPTTGTATYSLMGYTSPTATDGSSGYTVNGTLSANFAGTGTVGVNMTVANSANSYTINTLTTPLAITGSTFTGAIATTGSQVACSGCVTTSINGFFAGANASRAGLSYSISDCLGN